jgi:hypothetical protein
MRHASNWLTALGCVFLLAASALAAEAPVPTAVDQEIKGWLDKLTELSELIARNEQSPQAWRHHLAQAEVMLHIAARSRPSERDGWLRMAVDGYYSAAVQAPDSEPATYQRLAQLPGLLARAYPGSDVPSYAALQEIQADHARAVARGGDSSARAQERLRDRLLSFAQERPRAPEATRAILDAGQISESLGKTEDARRCYRYLAERYAGQDVARKAGASLWRLGLTGEVLRLKLPLLFATGTSAEPAFDLQEVRGKLVVVYFWASTSALAAEDFQAMRNLANRYGGLEVVCVNLDREPALGRAFLSGRLTVGTHVFQSGGLDGAVAVRYGLPALPQAFLLNCDGGVIQHAQQPGDLESVVADRLPRSRR